jgi:hypothetical protein
VAKRRSCTTGRAPQTAMATVMWMTGRFEWSLHRVAAFNDPRHARADSRDRCGIWQIRTFTGFASYMSGVRPSFWPCGGPEQSAQVFMWQREHGRVRSQPRKTFVPVSFCCVPMREPPPGQEASSNSNAGMTFMHALISEHPAHMRKRGTKCKTTLIATTA